MDRVLLHIAYTDLDNAHYNLNRANEDEMFLRPAGNHTEQAIEKILKQAAKELGIEFAEDHKISQLVPAFPVPNRYVTEEQLEFLEPYLGMLYGWATKLKYNGNCVATRRTIVKLLEFADQLYIDVCAAIADADAEFSAENKRPIGNSVKTELKGLSFDDHLRGK